LRFFVGVDFGATKIRAGVVGEDGRILGRGDVDTEPRRGLEAVLANLERAVDLACRESGTPLDDASGLGVAAPGQVDRTTLTVVQAPNLGWRHVPLGALLRERFAPLPVALQNDVKAAALGEQRFGAGQGVRDLVAVFVGTGVGGGIIAGGELVDGATGAAGEVGHLVYRPEGGERCSCGAYGHYEAYAGGAAVEQRFRQRVRAGLETRALELVCGHVDAISLGTIFEAAARGDGPAREVVDELESALGGLAANLATLLNPSRIVIGGGIVRKHPHIIERVEACVRELALEAARGCEVVPSALWEDAAVLGSAAAAAAKARP